MAQSPGEVVDVLKQGDRKSKPKGSLSKLVKLHRKFQFLLLQGSGLLCNHKEVYLSSFPVQLLSEQKENQTNKNKIEISETSLNKEFVVKSLRVQSFKWKLLSGTFLWCCLFILCKVVLIFESVNLIFGNLESERSRVKHVWILVWITVFSKTFSPQPPPPT